MLETKQHNCFLCGRSIENAFVLWDKTIGDRIINSTVVLEKSKMIHGKTVICPCGLAQESEPMTEESLNKFYSKPEKGESIYRQFYPIPPGAVELHIRNSLEYLFKTTVINRMTTKYNILIVGSGNYESMHLINNAFPMSKVYTFEPGLPKSDFNFQEKPDMQFDFIFCNNTLEHVFDPVTFLESLKSLFHPMTSMVLSVPDLLTKSVNMGKDRWFSNAHIYHFTFDSLWATICKAGLGVTKNIAFITEEMGDKIYFNVRLQDPLNPVKLEDISLSQYHMNAIKSYIKEQDDLYYLRKGILKDYEKLRKDE